MTEKKKFKDTKLGKFLSDKVPGVLDVVDDYFPPAKILTALIGKESLPPEDQLEFEKLLAEHEKEIYALDVQDRDSARHREIEITKTVGHADKMQIFVGVAIILAFFTSLILIGFKEIPARNEHIMINALGILEGGILSVITYYYGSSMGSRLKDMKK